MAPARQCFPSVITITALISMIFAALPESAEAQSPSTRIYLRITGEHATVLSSASIRFQQPILRLLPVGFAGTAEMEQVYSQCASDVGASVSEVRECQLQAARRIMVDEVIEISASSPSLGTYELVLQVWSPDSNELIHGDFVEIEAETVAVAARSGLPTLAHSYLCFRGLEAHCEVEESAIMPANPTSSVVPPSGGSLEILNVTPAPVAVLINGQEVGVAPNQFFDLPVGRVDVTLRAPGYQDLSRGVTLTADHLQELNGLALEPLRATLAVTCNIEAAEIRVDGQVEGETRVRAAVELDLEEGRHLVTVSRTGYETVEERVMVTAGSRTTLDVVLQLSLRSGRTTASTTPVLVGNHRFPAPQTVCAEAALHLLSCFLDFCAQNVMVPACGAFMNRDGIAGLVPNYDEINLDCEGESESRYTNALSQSCSDFEPRFRAGE